MPIQPDLCLDCARNDHMLMTNASSIQNRKRKSGGMHLEFENTLRTWVNKTHAQRVNVSSKITKEMGIRILDRVNEMLSDEKIIHLT